MTRWVLMLMLVAGSDGGMGAEKYVEKLKASVAGLEVREPNESDCKVPGAVKTVVFRDGSKWFLDRDGKIIGGESAPEDGGK